MAKEKRVRPNKLFYGDNLDILRGTGIPSESVDLCYIDPPFNSKRDYNQIYKRINDEKDLAQAQAFKDTWVWDDRAREGQQELISNAGSRFSSETIELIKGLRNVLKEGSLLAYLISITLRAVEIHRVLKPTGVFYLHCDPTASHYLKIVLDSIFIPKGGDFANEIIWCYAGGGIPKHDFPRKHDVLLRYTKSTEYYYVPEYREYTAGTVQRGRTKVKGKYFDAGLRKEGTPVNDWWTDVPKITSPTDPEKLGYPTQKPRALLKRIIETSSREGDVVLDAYCGCGTTIDVAQRLNRNWIGIDITYQSIGLVYQRLEAIGPETLADVTISGVPRDIESARALAAKDDDRVRKEFEKWAIMTYTNNHAVINEKKGSDLGIDGLAFFLTSKSDNARVVFQVKSGGVKRGDIATLRGDMDREKAAMAILITLEEPTAPMIREAKAAGTYYHDMMDRSYDKIQIVTVQDILESHKRLELPMSLEVLRAAQAARDDRQLGFKLS